MVKLLKESFIDVLQYDLDKTIADLDKFIAEANFVIHLAGVNRPLTSEEFYNGNTNFTKLLVDKVISSGRNIPIIMSSSIQASLDNDYGKSKKMAEDYLFSSNLDVYIFRLANVYGKWCKPNYNSAAATFMYNIANNLDVEIRDKNYVVHYNYVEDITKTFLRCVKGEIKPSKNILTVKPVDDISLGKLVDTLRYFKNSVESDEHLPTIKNEFEYKLFISFLDYLKDDSFSYNHSSDQRGYFEEIYKSKKHGQISINMSYVGVLKGGHYHTYKEEIFMTVIGKCETRTRNINSEIINKHIQIGEESTKVNIHPNETHDIRNIGNTNSYTLMWISEVYNENTSDTFKLEVEKKL